MAGTRKCWTNQVGWILPSGMDSARGCVIYFTKPIEQVYLYQTFFLQKTIM